MGFVDLGLSHMAVFPPSLCSILQQVHRSNAQPELSRSVGKVQCKKELRF